MKRGLALGVGAVALAAAVGLVGRVAADDKDLDGRRESRVVRLHGGGGRLGVSLAEVGADDVARLKLSEERGALVRDVEDGSAAEEAGLKDGDVIIGYEGDKVSSASQLARLVRETPAGRKVELEVSREGQVQRLTATLRAPRTPRWMSELMDSDIDLHDLDQLGDLPVPPTPPEAPRAPRPPLLDQGHDWGGFFFGGRPTMRLGIRYQELDGQLARYFKLEDRGVLVTHVEPGSAAEKAGLRAGDVLTAIGGDRVVDGSDVRRAVREAEAGASLKVTVLRDGRAVDLTVTLPAKKERSGSPA
jgi:serine protease Do